MKIYFSTSITGGRNDAVVYAEILKLLENYGEVLSKKNGDLALTSMGDTDITDREIYERDIGWLMDSDVFITEVTTPSLGVGYEIAFASSLGKKILCLYREIPNKRVSAMIKGDNKLTIKVYKDINEISEILKNFLK